MLTAKAGTGEKSSDGLCRCGNTDMRFDVIKYFMRRKTENYFLLKLIILKMLFNKGTLK